MEVRRLLKYSETQNIELYVSWWITLRNSKRCSHRSGLSQPILVLYLRILSFTLTNFLLSLIQSQFMFNYFILSLKNLHANTNAFNWLYFNWLHTTIGVCAFAFLFHWNYQDLTNLDCLSSQNFCHCYK